MSVFRKKGDGAEIFLRRNCRTVPEDNNGFNVKRFIFCKKTTTTNYCLWCFHETGFLFVFCLMNLKLFSKY